MILAVELIWVTNVPEEFVRNENGSPAAEVRFWEFEPNEMRLGV